MVIWSRRREGQEEGGVMVWSRWARQDGGDEEQMNETGQSWCEVGRQEGGGVVMWSRRMERQEEGGVMVWSWWVRQEGGGVEYR